MVSPRQWSHRSLPRLPLQLRQELHCKETDENAFVGKPFEEKVQLFCVLSEGGLSSSDSGTLPKESPKETPTEKGTGKRVMIVTDSIPLQSS